MCSSVGYVAGDLIGVNIAVVRAAFGIPFKRIVVVPDFVVRILPPSTHETTHNGVARDAGE